MPIMLRRAASTWQVMCEWKLRGPWRPGAHNIVMLIVQIASIWGAAQRGMDYFQSANKAASADGLALSGIETSVPLHWLGLAFLLPAGLAFFGLASGWARPLSVGHLLIGTSYLVLGITYLRQTAVDNLPLAGAGSALLLAAAFLLVTRFQGLPDIVALTLGLAAMLVGGWVAAKGLGFGYRTGNGFLVGAVYNFAFGFGTQVLSRRMALLRCEDEADDEALSAAL